MSLEYYALYLLLAVGTVLCPGPAVIYTIGNTLTRGTRHAIAGFVGVAVGILLVATLASLAVLLFTGWLADGQQILTLGGALYLLYLGVNSWRQRAVGPVVGASTDRDCGRSFAKGALISLLNPKAIIFFTSLFPQFIDFRQGGAGPVHAAGADLQRRCAGGARRLLSGVSLGRHAGVWRAFRQRYQPLVGRDVHRLRNPAADEGAGLK